MEESLTNTEATRLKLETLKKRAEQLYQILGLLNYAAVNANPVPCSGVVAKSTSNWRRILGVPNFPTDYFLASS
jgi:hypothetical protein